METSEKIKTIPHRPGVYIMKDREGAIIYIGKAKDLQKRVSSYFTRTIDHPKLESLVQSIESIDTVITDNEVEALILESNLVRKHKPKFNIELKDNQKYPFIKITNEPYPRIVKTRIRTDDSSLYFGPYPNVKYMNRTIKTITDIFPIIRCKRKFDAGRGGLTGTACMNYYLGKCVCPYINEVSREEYARLVDQVVLFLKGQNTQLLGAIKKEMLRESREKRFERAIQLRERYRAIRTVLDDQKITSMKGENEDIFGVAQAGEACCVTLLTRRDGKIVGKRDFVIEGGTGEEDVLDQFLSLYYQEPERAAVEPAPDTGGPGGVALPAPEAGGASHAASARVAEAPGEVPDAILLPFELEPADAVRELLKQRYGKTVAVTVPRRGAKKRLVELARTNAFHKIREELFRYDSEKAAGALKAVLELESPPVSIEAFDISTTLGNLPVASMVRFSKGLPDRKGYRHFKIRFSEGQNDVEMMKEVVARRYQRLLNEGKPLPDLVLVDGGVPQVNAAREVFDALGLGSLPLIGLAKREEEIFRHGRQEPIVLERGNEALRLLMAVRNEAHRFANTYHLKLRAKESIASRLLTIPGIGKELAKTITAAVDDLSGIASPEELAKLPGIGKKRAELVYRILKETTLKEE
jgi:excinuclease ABC subunit C